MFAEGQLLRFDPFLFKNGAPSKPKFYVVLKHMDSLRLAQGKLSAHQNCVRLI